MKISRLLVLLSGMVALFAGGAAAIAADAPSAGGRSSNDYQLQPGDVVHVQVFQELDLERELRVSQDGLLTFPLIGNVDVKGKTLGAVEQVVRSLYD